VAVAEDQRAVAHDVVDELVAIGVPLAAAYRPVNVDRERVEPARVVGQTARENLKRLARKLIGSGVLTPELGLDLVHT